MVDITVKPSGATNAVSVKTDVFENVHFPVYKISYSLDGDEPVPVSTGSPLPVGMYDSDGNIVGIGDTALKTESINWMSEKELLSRLLEEQKITNLYFQEMMGMNFRRTDIDNR